MTKEKKKKITRLILDDYHELLRLVQEDAGNEELEQKLYKKIDQLQNPPEKNPREKTGFECVKCKHKFKQVRNHCPTCDGEKLKEISLSEFM